jgi:hypothetical protein
MFTLTQAVATYSYIDQPQIDLGNLESGRPRHRPDRSGQQFDVVGTESWIYNAFGSVDRNEYG